MMQCPECGADGRVGYVTEECGRVEIKYICPNKKCVHYSETIGTETVVQTENE